MTIGQLWQLLTITLKQRTNLNLHTEERRKTGTIFHRRSVMLLKSKWLQRLQVACTLKGSIFTLQLTLYPQNDILKEVQSWESINLIQFGQNRVCSSVHFSNIDFTLKVISQILPDRSQFLTMSAPLFNQIQIETTYRSIELDKPTTCRWSSCRLCKGFKVIIIQLNNFYKLQAISQ